MIIHISEDRLEKVKAGGWKLGKFDAPSDIRCQKSDVEYHLLKNDHETCSVCGKHVESVPVNNVIELETVKAIFKVYDNGYGPPNFSAKELRAKLDLAAA